jgi:hypothetical protein
MGGDLAHTGLGLGVHAMYRPSVTVMKAPTEPCCGRDSISIYDQYTSLIVKYTLNIQTRKNFVSAASFCPAVGRPALVVWDAVVYIRRHLTYGAEPLPGMIENLGVQICSTVLV